MNHTILRVKHTALDRQILLSNFVEPKLQLNEHVIKRVYSQARLIKEALLFHGYPIYKMRSRPVWRIGHIHDCYLLSYQFDPFKWVLFPHNQNLANIINSSLNAHLY